MNGFSFKLLNVLAYGALVAGSPAFAADPAPNVAELIKEADRARGAVAASEGVTWDIVVDTVEDKSTTKVNYHVKVKGVDALAEATAPAKNKGEVMLFNDRNLWFFKPGLKKPVSISARQKLMGMASNGDIASTNYYRDYDAKMAGEDTIDGVKAWKLELKAKAKNVTYDAIRYWISKSDRLGIKAEFMTVSGEVFKSARFAYNNKMSSGGNTYPFVSEMKITDAKNSKNQTTLNYKSPKAEKHADSIFNVNNLLR